MTALTFIVVAIVLFNIAIVLAIVHLARITWRLDQFRKGLIAHAKLAPAAPPPLLIKDWQKMYDELPKDSPKWIAYKNRLIEIGVLDKDGKPIPKAKDTDKASDGD